MAVPVTRPKARAMDALVEPDDSIEVQVVGGLVQQQQRGLHEQRPGWVDGGGGEGSQG